MTGVPPSGSGHSPKGGAASSTASPAKPSVPNAEWLWCVHIIGPDDIHAAPDFDTAERWAVRNNKLMREYAIAAGMENDPYWPEVRAVVALWPWDAESHASDIPNSVRDFAPPASAIEAPSGVETGNTDSTEGESAIPKGDAR